MVVSLSWWLGASGLVARSNELVPLFGFGGPGGDWGFLALKAHWPGENLLGGSPFNRLGFSLLAEWGFYTRAKKVSSFLGGFPRSSPRPQNRSLGPYGGREIIIRRAPG